MDKRLVIPDVHMKCLRPRNDNDGVLRLELDPRQGRVSKTTHWGPENRKKNSFEKEGFNDTQRGLLFILTSIAWESLT